jgi:hypothetical protein
LGWSYAIIKADIVIMKRNMDLMREILLVCEKYEHGFAPQIVIDGYSPEEIGYHVFLLGEAGLAEVEPISAMGAASPYARIKRLTWNGHEFLDASREKTIWEKTKTKVGEIGGVALPLLMTLLADEAKRKLGL